MQIRRRPTAESSTTPATPVELSHLGERHAFGRQGDSYGVWRDGPGGWQIVERWPATAAGWFKGWARFRELEATPTPSDDVTIQLASAWRPPRFAIGLLLLGVFAGAIGLFGPYLGGRALIAQSDQLSIHVVDLAVWAVATVALAVHRRSAHLGALFALGASAISFGLLLGDAGEVASNGAHVAGIGVVLAAVSWMLCSAGTVAALVVVRGHQPIRVRRWDPRLLAPVALLSVGAAIAWAVAWDRYVLTAANGQSEVVTAGNAFAAPGWVMAADMIAMLLIIAVPVVAAQWRWVRGGMALLAGALAPLGAQVLAALLGISAGATPAMFGLSPSQVSTQGITISSGLTAAFWIYAAFVVGLVVYCLVEIRLVAHVEERPRAIGHDVADGAHPTPLARS